MLGNVGEIRYMTDWRNGGSYCDKAQGNGQGMKKDLL
jgi:hypothetical protein